MTGDGLTKSSALDVFRLDDRLAVITGGARGIGRAIAQAFCDAGCRVVVADIDAPALAAAAHELVASGGIASTRLLDVTDSGAVERCAESVCADYGDVDILVNNAGIVRNADALDVDDAQWNAVLDVNLGAVFRCSRAFGRRMVGRGRGSIVNIIVRPQAQASYNASKAGVDLLTKSLAAEWAGHNVRVNAVAPGYIATELTLRGRTNAVWYDTWLAQTPMQRLGEPREIASVVLFLASDAASFITGTIITADGGYTLW
jgi:NAD(P)-dependent dehydrogenase (short-subunit alcohol dehydrogenase family)